MKKECAVVQDLLVLYEDDVLREQSKEMVEEHIRGCEECMQVYENIGRELPAVEPVAEPSEDAVKKNFPENRCYSGIRCCGAVCGGRCCRYYL